LFKWSLVVALFSAATYGAAQCTVSLLQAKQWRRLLNYD
jgi:hypothetical protein